MSQERVIGRELTEKEIRDIFGFEKVWNGAEKVFQEWGEIHLPTRPGDSWQHRWLISRGDGKFNLAVDFWKETCTLALLDPESGKELGIFQMPKFKGLWVKPQFVLDRGEQQIIGFREDVNGQEFVLKIKRDGQFRAA